MKGQLWKIFMDLWRVKNSFKNWGIDKHTHTNERTYLHAQFNKLKTIHVLTTQLMQKEKLLELLKSPAFQIQLWLIFLLVLLFLHTEKTEYFLKKKKIVTWGFIHCWLTAWKSAVRQSHVFILKLKLPQINFNFPTNQKCLSYFNLIWSFVVIFVIAWGSTYSLSKFSRLHYKSFKSLDHNVHSVWHVKRGNMNITPQGEMSTAGPGRPVSTTNSGNLQNSLEPGQRPHCHLTPQPNTWAWVSCWGQKTTWLSLDLENTVMEVTTRNLSLSHKNLKRIQTVRCVVWFGCYYKALEKACGPEARAVCQESCSGRKERPLPEYSPFWPWFFYLLKLRSFGFMDIWNIPITSSFLPSSVNDSSNSTVQYFPDFFWPQPIMRNVSLFGACTHICIIRSAICNFETSKALTLSIKKKSQ